MAGADSCKYDVFLSFRGEDTRKNFVCHLYRALEQKLIFTFIDSKDLDKGNRISEILKAIEDSRLSIVVLSENYASSSWCLEELIKILECMDTNNQIVVPIFYQVDPSHIRYLNGEFGEAFAKHKHGDDKQELESWRSTLARVADLSGWDSSNYPDDLKLIEEIVQDIWEKCIHIAGPSSATNDLVGMDYHIKEVSLRLCRGVNDVGVVGIWGMGGIGKTTIAKVVYGKIAYQFEHKCFLSDVKEGFAKKGEAQMRGELLSEILKGKVQSADILNVGSNMMERLGKKGKKKVLVVLDDVENFAQIEALLGNLDSFGIGSRIIITTRDKQSLSGVVELYEPKLLNGEEADELFMKYAFRKNQPTGDYDHLSRRAIEYAQGLPLALKVLGASLCDKTEREWKGVLKKLKKIPHIGILDVLKTSIEGLDDSEKDIFLDIACFFRGMRTDFVIEILDSCGFFPDTGLSVLGDRALITISPYLLDMHDLLEEMGREIVRQESIKDPGRRSRLWNYEDVNCVLNKSTATEAVECIILDLLNSEIDLCINTRAFVRMTKLRLLMIYYVYPFDLDICPRDGRKQHATGDFEFLSHELRFLCWHGCPLKSFPSNFNPENLVKLDMRGSHIQLLWEGTKPLKKLKVILLSDCQNLVKTPDLTEATNLEIVVLDGCSSLIEVHPSISALQNLLILSLKGCKELEIFPSSIHMKSLRTLNLSGCSNLDKFPEISEVMKKLSQLFLDETAIEELPSSINNLTGLQCLSMENCRNLVSLPDNICNLVCLTNLCLSGCSELHSLPENLDNLKSLRNLQVDGSRIKQLPFAILRMSTLAQLSCVGCRGMTAPFSAWSSSIEQYCRYSCLVHLDLSDCNLLELSNGIAHLSSLETLKLCRNNLESLPGTIHQLGCLKQFNLEGCKKLKSIPELSSSIISIDAHDCTALETISTLKPPYQTNLCFTFSNCFQLVQTNLFRDIVETHQDNHLQPLSLNMSLPGSEIPPWFDHQCRGSSVTVQLPSKWFNTSLGFAICFVRNFNGSPMYSSGLSARLYCTFKGNHGEHSFSFSLVDRRFRTDGFLESDHMFLGYVPWSKYCLIEEGKPVNEGNYTDATFEIVVGNGVYTRRFRKLIQRQCIRSCGVCFYHGNLLEVGETMELSELGCHIGLPVPEPQSERKEEKESMGVSVTEDESVVGRGLLEPLCSCFYWLAALWRSKRETTETEDFGSHEWNKD